MAATDTTSLAAASREAGGSRTTRRLRREGLVPGIVYGGEGDSVPFQVDARELRNALAHGGAVIDLAVDGGKAEPVVVKEEQRHPVNGALLHVDLLRVRLDRPIQATTVIEIVGAEDAPGVKEGGVLEQVTRDINIEALPTSIPDSIQHDVSSMEINDTVLLSAVAAPEGVTFLDDPEETVVASLSPPRVEEEPELEEETALVGEDGEPVEGEAPADGEDAGEGDAGGGGDESE
ncbi:MAG TPA: 50S ribosomal protein L25 [Solirubrobacteraceae bacterium]|nr:50S ribosomal protein L25 [Solirubrobacteraceae bacterium]